MELPGSPRIRSLNVSLHEELVQACLTVPKQELLPLSLKWLGKLDRHVRDQDVSAAVKEVADCLCT